jgi:hypothetical protein
MPACRDAQSFLYDTCRDVDVFCKSWSGGNFGNESGIAVAQLLLAFIHKEKLAETAKEEVCVQK